MKKRTEFILWGGAAAVLTGIGVFFYASAQHLMTIALARGEPRSISKERTRIAGVPRLGEIMEQLEAGAKQLAEYQPLRVTLTATDGTPLIGHWLRHPHPKRVIVAMHGWRSAWDRDFGIITPFWFENGCSILYAEQRGQGESGGDHMGFGLSERHDCAEWVRWAVEETNGALPIYLGGVSMGASTVLMAAGGPLPPQVRGAIADCGFTSPREIWKHVAGSKLHLPFSLYGPLARNICRRRFQLDSEEYSCPEAMRHCKIPVLFIHGTEDEFVPPEMTFENYKACAAPKRIFMVSGADHGMSYLKDPEGYRRAVLDFWNEWEKTV